MTVIYDRPLIQLQVSVHIFDTSGLQMFIDVRSEFYRDAHGILLVFDVTNRDSFDSLGDWVRAHSKAPATAAAQSPPSVMKAASKWASQAGAAQQKAPPPALPEGPPDARCPWAGRNTTGPGLDSRLLLQAKLIVFHSVICLHIFWCIPVLSICPDGVHALSRSA